MTYYLHSTPSGIGLIPGEKMPPEPERDYRHGTSTEYVFKIEYEEYRKDLERAKAEAIPVQNQEVAGVMIRSQYRFTGDLRTDFVYGPFTGEYRIQERHSVRCASHTSEALMKRGHVPGECACKCEQVAFLLPEPEKQESQERPIEELFIEEYYGLKAGCPPTGTIKTDYGDMVNLLTMYKEKYFGK